MPSTFLLIEWLIRSRDMYMCIIVQYNKMLTKTSGGMSYERSHHWDGDCGPLGMPIVMDGSMPTVIVVPSID